MVGKFLPTIFIENKIMNYQIYIENLGAVEKADLKISPLTILAGENGTGKSFVTKFLYSIFNVAISDLFYDKIYHQINITQSSLSSFIQNEEFSSFEFEIQYLAEIHNFLNEIDTQAMSLNIPFGLFTLEDITKLEEYVNTYKNEIQGILSNYKPPESSLITESNEHPNSLSRYFKELALNHPSFRSELLAKNLSNLLSLIKDPQASYLKIFSEKLEDELKENFQIPQLNLLINSSKEVAIFKIESFLKVSIFVNNSLNLDFDFENFLNIYNINRLVFFESPIYWKILTLITNQTVSKKKFLSKRINTEILTGIPKHFLDLKELLFTDFKDGERPNFIVEIANDLQRHLKGKFHTSNNDLTFENDKGQTIPKCLVSFGMTNLGILQAVLSKNVINVGSFIFIDEPESNLHPAWQNILAETLVKLAENGVFVVITTHSTDMLKAFDIITQEKQKANDTKIKYDFLSTYYFQNDGLLLDTSNSELSPIEQARQKLLEPYDNMMVRGYLL